jgi:hypothetical protein
MAGSQLGDAVDVVVVVMGDENGAKPVAGPVQILEHRPCIAGIDHRDDAGAAQAPDVVVRESGQRKYFQGIHRQVF